MGRLNISLDDDLLERVRAANIPASAVCQRALRRELTRVDGERGRAVTQLMRTLEPALEGSDVPRQEISAAIDKALKDLLD